MNEGNDSKYPAQFEGMHHGAERIGNDGCGHHTVLSLSIDKAMNITSVWSEICIEVAKLENDNSVKENIADANGDRCQMHTASKRSSYIEMLI